EKITPGNARRRSLQGNHEIPPQRPTYFYKVWYIKINGKGPVTPVADCETLGRMARLLRKDGAAELFGQS
ncbi:unnamed protein product, partial [Sphacelaria rigidula]